MICTRSFSFPVSCLLTFWLATAATDATAQDDAATAAPEAALTGSIHASGCLLWDLSGDWTLAYDQQASSGDWGRYLATASLPPSMKFEQTGARLRGSITFPEVLSQEPLASGSVIGTISGDSFEVTATWRFTKNSNWNFEQTTIYDGQIARDGAVSGTFYAKIQGPGHSTPWHTERAAICKSNTSGANERRVDHGALSLPGLLGGGAGDAFDDRKPGSVAAAGATSGPPPIALGRVAPPPKALGRVRAAGPPDPSKTMCDYARSAKARNSPAAPGLERQCLAGGGSMTPPPPPPPPLPPPPVSVPDLDALAAVGAAIAAQDPAVEEARNAEAGAFYQLGFDVASGLFGDPALGSAGNTAMDPVSEEIRNSLSAAGQRGFNASAALHLARDYRH